MNRQGLGQDKRVGITILVNGALELVVDRREVLEGGGLNRRINAGRRKIGRQCCKTQQNERTVHDSSPP